MQVHIHIYGLVQGVFFRHSARQLAQELGLVGWIRNAPNGSVEAHAQGSKPNLEKFVTWCGKGPPEAKVEKVEIDWRKNLGDFEQFEVV